MTPPTTLSVTEARKNIFKIIEDTYNSSRYYTLTENGQPKVVVMSADEFESWKETLEIMSDPELVRDIKKAQKDIEEGNFENFIPLEDVLQERDAKKDGTRKKHVRRLSSPKSRKKSSKN
ncbi:MAG: type II toxin-antitoxin system Phd/YefM family antitoxin [Candidatus Kerfeldbacteria bacterium]|nr:type II toxin-antitoxin system Phd/YefM family antitoxin [Candidatus Kerfeldbacteria bacterium]